MFYDLEHMNTDNSIINQKTVPEFLELLVPVLQRRVKMYHQLFSLPLIAELWEETLHRSFQEIGQETTWKPTRSHAVGEDLRLDGVEQSRISCKSGQFIKDKSLQKLGVKFNGGRSTRHESLENKLAHFNQSHDDYYFLLAKPKLFNKSYKLLVFKSEICKVDKLTWKISDSGKTWNGTGEFKALIGKSMSAQLWTTLPLDMIEFSFDLNAE